MHDHGFVAALGDQGPARGPQNVFVNRRIVKDRTIAHAIIDAYSVATIKERSPEVHLFIEMPPDRVDVNVHPTKAEVRFREQSLVHEVLRRALGDALGQGRAPELQLTAIRWTARRAAADDDSGRPGWRNGREPLDVRSTTPRLRALCATGGRLRQARQDWRPAAGAPGQTGGRTRRRPAR